ncbi:HNH endonuclease [Chryseobacterium sp. Y16C]|uniref:HNH endonuclease n=1 Tax=Chryseobacterium sp. Y16C TaxID=2920939 RepID=UPI001F0B4129|nr:HNH endonuclease [Chryseobacterium sp. Y16C]UMQ42170.1 HNH endonuclease [Chryseobacterium sp. Y16C]
MIINESELRYYLTDIGLGKGSSSSYRSRLSFLLKNGIDINSDTINAGNLFNILKIKKLVYKDKSSLKTALATYKRFLASEYNILQDIEEINSKEISKTQKELLMKARIGQGKFRKDLIDLWGKCSVSQFEKVEFLVASHILPWKIATDVERLSKYNGLLLQPNIDKLFDKGFISFDDDGSIILSYKIDEILFFQLGINKSFKLYKIHYENIPFLRRHREIFKELLFKM